MKLISINIENNLHNSTVLEFLKKEKADVICLQEFLEDDFDLYKKELGLEGVLQISSYVANWIYPKLKGKKQGVAIFSKSITDSDSFFYYGKEENLQKSFDTYISNEDFRKNYGFVLVNIKNSDNAKYRFITTHLPVTKEGESSPYQLEVAESLLKKLESFGEFVLCGDMNAPRGNETFNRLARKYKDNIPPEYKTSIEQNLHRVKNLQYMVDGLFTTPSYIASNVKLVGGLSDHMAIIADISKD